MNRNDEIDHYDHVARSAARLKGQVGPAESNAAKGLRAALARNARLKAGGPAPAALAPAKAQAKPAPAKAAWPPKTEAGREAARIETQRFTTVMSSPHFAKHKDLAMTLLKNPRLSAAEVINLLAVTETPPDKQAAALSNIQRQGATATVLGLSTDVWAKAIANLNAQHKAGGAA
jgi:hypothetical protein